MLKIDRNRTPFCKKGTIVFTDKFIKKNKFILKFKGKYLNKNEINFPSSFSTAHKWSNGDYTQDYYLQISKDIFIGPSGYIDDHVNHSCDPNCGVVIKNNKAFLKSLRDITPGEEITFDYSSTQTYPNDDRNIISLCKCKSNNCRFMICNTRSLPIQRVYYYWKNGVMPCYALCFWFIDFIKNSFYTLLTGDDYMKKFIILAILLTGCAISQLPKDPEPEEADCIIGLSGCGPYCCEGTQACVKSKKTGNYFCSNK